MANVAVVVAALVVLVSFARNYFLPTPRVVLQGGLQKGLQLPLIPGIDFSRSETTLLVALDPGCDYCSESLPFLKNLADKIRGGMDGVHMVTVFQSRDESARRYLQQNQLNVDAVLGVDFKKLNLGAIPAIILSDKNGTVLDFWVGKPSAETEAQIARYLTSPATLKN